MCISQFALHLSASYFQILHIAYYTWSMTHDASLRYVNSIDQERGAWDNMSIIAVAVVAPLYWDR